MTLAGGSHRRAQLVGVPQFKGAGRGDTDGTLRSVLAGRRAGRICVLGIGFRTKYMSLGSIIGRFRFYHAHAFNILRIDVFVSIRRSHTSSSAWPGDIHLRHAPTISSALQRTERASREAQSQTFTPTPIPSTRSGRRHLSYRYAESRYHRHDQLGITIGCCWPARHRGPLGRGRNGAGRSAIGSTASPT